METDDFWDRGKRKHRLETLMKELKELDQKKV